MNTTGIYTEIYDSLVSDTMQLPALPEITLTIRKELLGDNCTVKSAAKLLKSDPGLVAFIMRITNSVRYLLRHPPRDIEAAVLRLGLKPTATLATTYATRSLFDSTSPVLKKILLKSYNSASNVAVLSCLLAERLPGFDADKAMLAGLLQDIALPPILLCLSNRPEIFDDEDKRLAAIDKLAPVISPLILEHWGFDSEIVDAVKARKKWDRNPQDKLDLGDIVLIARWYSLMGTPEFSLCPPFNEIPALKKLPPSELTGDASLALLEDSKEAMMELQSSLQVAA